MCTADILYDYKKTPNLNNAEKISSSDYNSISAFCECFSETIWKNKTTDKEELIKEKVYISEVINYCNEKFPINNSIIQESFTGNF